jgi:hypothetical protein
MVIRVTNTEAEISGSPTELRTIAEALSGSAAGQSWRFSADATASPAPYDNVLSEFQVVASEGLARVSVVGSWLVFEGDPEVISAFASWLQFPDAARSGDHGHYEWYPGHTSIAEDSLPLVISVA